MYGPAPKPTVIKVSEGNPGHRAINKNEPDYFGPVEVPPAPKWMDAEARRTWKKLAPELVRIRGLLRDVDLLALEAACRAYSSAIRSEKILNEKGFTYIDANGNPRARAENKLCHDAWNRYRQYAQEFGFTPASRSRIAVPNEPGRPAGKKMTALEEKLSAPEMERLERPSLLQ